MILDTYELIIHIFVKFLLFAWKIDKLIIIESALVLNFIQPQIELASLDPLLLQAIPSKK